MTRMKGAKKWKVSYIARERGRSGNDFEACEGAATHCGGVADLAMSRSSNLACKFYLYPFPQKSPYKTVLTFYALKS